MWSLKLVKKLVLRTIGCHGFRHSFGAHYMMERGSLWDLQKILGHSNIKTTEEHYAHFSKEHIRKRASVVSFNNNVKAVDFKQVVARTMTKTC